MSSTGSGDCGPRAFGVAVLQSAGDESLQFIDPERLFDVVKRTVTHGIDG